MNYGYVISNTISFSNLCPFGNMGTVSDAARED